MVVSRFRRGLAVCVLLCAFQGCAPIDGLGYVLIDPGATLAERVEVEALQNLERWVGQDSIADGNGLVWFGRVIFLFFSIILVTTGLVQYMLAGRGEPLLVSLLTISVLAVVLAQLPLILSSLWQAQEGLRSGVIRTLALPGATVPDGPGGVVRNMYTLLQGQLSRQFYVLWPDPRLYTHDRVDWVQRCYPGFDMTAPPDADGNRPHMVFSELEVAALDAAGVPKNEDGSYGLGTSIVSMMDYYDRDAVYRGGVAMSAEEREEFVERNWSNCNPDYYDGWNPAGVGKMISHSWAKFLSFFQSLPRFGGAFVSKIAAVLLLVYVSLLFVWAPIYYFLVCLTGPVLLPFYLWDRFRFVAEGWIRSLATAWLYGLVATLVLVFIGWLLTLIPELSGDPNLIGNQTGVGVFLYSSSAMVFQSIIVLVFCLGLAMKVGQITNSLVSGGMAASGGGSAAAAVAKRAAPGLK